MNIITVIMIVNYIVFIVHPKKNSKAFKTITNTRNHPYGMKDGNGTKKNRSPINILFKTVKDTSIHHEE